MIRRGRLAVAVAWFAGILVSLILWNSLQHPADLPADGSWGWRLLRFLGDVPHSDPALIARVRATRIAVIVSAACLACFGYLERARVSGAIRRYFATPSHPINLAIFRIVVFWQAYRLGYFDLIATIVGQPDTLQVPPPTGIPAIGPLAAFSHWPINPLEPSGVLLLGQVMKAACITGMLGFFTRTSTLVAAFTFFFGWGAAQWYGKVDHHHHVLWFILVLAASRCGDAMSVDSLVRAWRRGRRGDTEPPQPAVAYGLPLRMCILLMGVLYFFPGFWKIWRSGFDWFLSDSPFNQMYIKWHMLGDWLPSIRPDRIPLLVHAGALGTILFELSFIFLIFGRRTFYLAGVLGAGFHTALNFFMRHGFESLRNSYVAFVNWHGAMVWTGRRLYRRALTVRFDSADSRTAPLIACARSLDWLDAIDWQDGASQGVEVHAEGKTWRDMAAFRRVALRLPLLWPLAIPLQLAPGRGSAGPAPSRRAVSIPAIARGAHWRDSGIRGPLLVGALLFVGNSWAGINRMQEGWPLACYPLFDGLIGEWYTSLRIVAEDGNGATKVIVPDDYRTVFGDNWSLVLRRLLSEKEVRRRVLLRSIWDILKGQDPSLGETRIVKFYTVRSSLRPELWKRPPDAPELILTIEL